MKSSLGKQLKKFALHKHETKDKKDHHALAFSDALEHASLDMKDMRSCCDSLLSAAAATTNSAYEFSESLLEMGNSLLERTTLDDSGECGKALSMLGKVQLELQKLVDGYRSHVIQTITNPSESLLSELRKVEEMKLQCDEKKEMYEHIVTQHREKGKSRSGKGESFSLQQLQAAREEYDEVARLCVFRVESLKQGQCRSLLTQAARHHAAQLIFFRKGLKSLEAVEPYISIVAEKHHIDYKLSGIEDGEVGGNNDDTYDIGELSFDNRDGKLEQENTSTSRNSMELDQIDPSTMQTSGLEDIEFHSGKKKVEQGSSQKARVSSYSAPIYSDKFDLSEKIRELQTPVPKFHAYALPTPADARSSTSRLSTSVIHSNTGSVNGSNNNLWHSSPLDIEKPRKFLDDNLISSTASKAQAVVKDSESNKPSLPLPSPVSDGKSPPRFESSHNGHDARKVKRQAFSGPLLGKPSTSKPVLSSSGPIGPAEVPQVVSGLLSRIATTQIPPPTLNVPQSVSPPLASSPKISELHELPRPPGSFPSKPTTSTTAGHSAPLNNRNREVSPTNRSPFVASSAGSRLPPPPLTVSRSFSIPSSSHRAAAMHVTKLLESDIKDKAEGGGPSPPLTPISLSTMRSAAIIPELTSNSAQIRGRS